MKQIIKVMSQTDKRYPFELVIARKGTFVMSSKSFDELSQTHYSKYQILFRDFLQVNGYSINSNASGSYTIFKKNFEKSDLEKKEETIQFSKLRINYQGREMTFMNIMRMKGYSHNQSQTIRSRISRGWDAIKAIDEPIREITRTGINVEA